MLDDLFVSGLRSEYQEAFDGYASMYPSIAMTVNSTKSGEDYSWLGSVPRMRKFRGERQPVQVGNYKYHLDNEEYEASMAIDMKDIEDDQTGKYALLASQIGESSAMYPDELIYGTLLPSGFSTLAYDGQYFFDTDHQIGDVSQAQQSNLITGKLGPTAFKAARLLFRRFKDDFGRPVNPTLDLEIIVPPELESSAYMMFLRAEVSPGVANEFFNQAKVTVNPWLTDPNAWYLVNRAGVVKPFVLQNRLREDLAVLGNYDPNSASANVVNQAEAQFMRRKVYTGTFWRGAAGFALFQKAVASTGATGTQDA